MQQTITSTSIGKLRERVRLLLGGLWLLDGLLQLQPMMFTQSFPSQVLLPALQNFPPPISNLTLDKLYPAILNHVVAFNLIAIVVQVGLGILLLYPSRRLNFPGLIMSAAWSAIIWVFGQAFGGVWSVTQGGLTLGEASVYSGFPGSALLYLYLSAILLAPKLSWERGTSSVLSPIWDFAPILLASAFIFQLNPQLFTAAGQATIFQANIQNNIPPSLAWSVAPFAALAQSHPVAADIVEAAWIGLTALLLANKRTRSKRITLFVAAALFGFIWWFGLGLGGIFTGLGTDPNTPPLLLAAAYISTRKAVAAEENEPDLKHTITVHS